MIYYHLHDSGEGLKLGFLGIFDNFDGASDAADKLVEEAKVGASAWILDRPSVETLFASMHKEIPELLPPAQPIISTALISLPEDLIQANRDCFESAVFMDRPVRLLNRDSLLAVIGILLHYVPGRPIPPHEIPG